MKIFIHALKCMDPREVDNNNLKGEQMFRKIVLAVISVAFTCTLASAAPVRLPSNAGKTESLLGEIAGGKVLVGVGAELDHVDNTKLKDNSEHNYDSASGLLSLTYDKKYSVYGTVGQIIDPEFKGSDAGDTFSVKFDNALIWGVGANAVIMENEGWQLFTDGSYNATLNMDIYQFRYNSTVYNKWNINNDASIEGKLEQWQVALGVTKDFQWVKPYAGVKYFDTKDTMKVTAAGDSVSGVETNKYKFGVFVGTSVTPIKGVELNIQGRLIDESAIMGSATFKF